MSPEGVCIKSELYERILQSLTELSPSMRRVIQMRDLDGLTTSEVAKTLGLSEGTVKAQGSMRRVIQMRDLDGLTTSEVAKTLGLSEGTVKAQVSRARSKLRQLMPGLKNERIA